MITPRVPAARQQSGVVSRTQALGSGLTARQVDWLVRSGRWRRLLPGVFAVHAGPLDARARVWAAVLHAGDGACAGGATALWLCGAVDDPPAVVTVCIPESRRLARAPRIRVVRRRDLDRMRHPAAEPPRLRVEEAVLDVADEAKRPEVAVDVVIRAVQRRLTTAARLRDSLAERPRHRWRKLLGLVLEEVVVGVRSALERLFLKDVERRHGLPPGRYNPLERVSKRRRDTRRYRDVRYEAWRLVVEIDGAEAHLPEDEHEDHRRDNAVAASGRSSLRYGWREIAGEPCLVAEEVAQSLIVRGWGGGPVPCGPGCPLADDIAESRLTPT